MFNKSKRVLSIIALLCVVSVTAAVFSGCKETIKKINPDEIAVTDTTRKSDGETVSTGGEQGLDTTASGDKTGSNSKSSGNASGTGSNSGSSSGSSQNGDNTMTKDKGTNPTSGSGTVQNPSATGSKNTSGNTTQKTNPSQTTPTGKVEPPYIPPPEPGYVYKDGYVNLIKDENFDNGLLLGNVQDGIPPNPNDTINFKNPASQTAPDWALAQWYSKYDIRGVSAVKQGSSYVLKNKGKSVTMGNNSFTIEVLGGAEYSPNEDGWPHLIMSQDFYDLPKLSEIDQAALKFDVKTNYLKTYPSDDKKENITPLLIASFIIQDRNTNSPGFGDYYWLQLPLFDIRHNIFSGWEAGDTGGKEIVTNKYMVSAASSKYYNGTFDLNKTISINADIYSIIVDGYKKAVATGNFLKNSSLSDMTIAGVTFGWEVFGAYDTSATFSDVSFTVHYKDNRSLKTDASFSNGFNKASEWSVKDGSGTIKSGVFTDSSGSGWNSRAILKTSTYKNFTLETELKFDAGDSGNGWAGISFRKPSEGMTHEEGGYSLMLKPDGTLFFHSKGGSLSGSRKISGYNKNSYVKIKIVAAGNKFTVYVNGSSTPLLTATDSGGAYSDYGFVGVISGMSKASFRSFTVTAN